MGFGCFTSMYNAYRSAQRTAVKIPTPRKKPAPRPQQRVRVRDAQASDQCCRECQRPMYHCLVNGQDGHHCPSCDSYVFEREIIRTLTRGRETITGRYFRSRTSRYSCCERPMKEQALINPHNVLVDHCTSCDIIYLEGGELERVLKLST